MTDLARLDALIYQYDAVGSPTADILREYRSLLDGSSVLVPREPTVAMRMPWHRQGGLRHASFYQKWKAMIAAVEKDRPLAASKGTPDAGGKCTNTGVPVAFCTCHLCVGKT